MQGTGYRVNRKQTRFSLDQRVRITLVSRDEGVVLRGRTCDISEAGMCAQVSGELKLADGVLIELACPEEETLHLKATVRHARGFTYGFEFEPLDKKLKSLLVKLITRNASPKLRS